MITMDFEEGEIITIVIDGYSSSSSGDYILNISEIDS